MIDNCANSQCNKSLHYFREGIIYAVDKSTETSGFLIEHFWLCGECAIDIIKDQKAGRQWRLEVVSNVEPWPPHSESVGPVRIAS
jgi:hypothetical protein